MIDNLYVKTAIEYLGKETFKDLLIDFIPISDDVLTIKREKNKITISYHQLSHMFYALTLIKQRENEEDYKVSLRPRFQYTGLMKDCSRNGVLNIKYIKEMITLSALMGLNRFMLYTEEVYEIKGEPYFGYLRGRYTKAEIKEIVKWAEGFGVEVIPCIQTLAHLDRLIRWRPYNDMASSPNALQVGNEKTYELIEKMIKTCAENFHTKNIHIGMDEASDLGLKEFIHDNKFIDKKSLFLEHLNKVVDICHKYEMHPMMWEDMFFKIDPKGHFDWYNFDGKLEDDIKALIPEDVELIYWDYYHDDIKVYDKMFEASLDTKRNIIFAGSVFSWVGFVPNFEKSLKFSSLALKSAINHRINSSFICFWGDEGSECSASSLYPLLAQQCLYNFYGQVNERDLSSLLKTVTGHDLEDWLKLQLPNYLREELLQFENPSKSFFYQDILLGLFDSRVKDEFSIKYAGYALELSKIIKESSKFNYVFEVAKDLCECLSHKVVIGKNIRQAYKDNNKKKLAELIDELAVIKELVQKFHASFRKQWDKENKPFGFEVTDGRIGFLLQRIDTASLKLKEYLEGSVDNIPELEEDILPYNAYPNDEPHCFNSWADIASVNKI